MMAKRPEKRFKDYDELLAALEVVPTDPSEIGLAPLDEELDAGESSSNLGLPLMSHGLSPRSADAKKGGVIDQTLVETMTLELGTSSGPETGRPGSPHLHASRNATARPKPRFERELNLGDADVEEEEHVKRLANSKHLRAGLCASFGAKIADLGYPLLPDRPRDAALPFRL